MKFSPPAEGFSLWHFIRVTPYIFAQYYANAALCTPCIPVGSFRSSRQTINTLLLQSGFIPQALCECADVPVRILCERAWCWCAWMSDWMRTWKWKQLSALVPCFDVRNKKKLKKKIKMKKEKNRHKWQMAILVALQCCSPLAYIETSFYSV